MVAHRFISGRLKEKSILKTIYKILGWVGAIWGIGGFGFILIYSVMRLGTIALDSFSYQLQWYHWLVLLVNTLLLAFFEGYRGFQKGFSPRMAARAKYLKEHPALLHVVLAPFFCIGYYYASRRRIIANFTLTFVIIGFILLIRLLNQPWRGLIDVGVVVGLSWGLVTLIIFSSQALTSDTFDFPPDIPQA